MEKKGRKRDGCRSLPLVPLGQPLYRLFRCSISPCYVTLTGGSRKPVLAETAGRPAATVGARDNLAVHVLQQLKHNVRKTIRNWVMREEIVTLYFQRMPLHNRYMPEPNFALTKLFFWNINIEPALFKKFLGAPEDSLGSLGGF